MSNAYRSVLASGGVTPTGDAVAADVLAGKTFSNANAIGVTGTMVNRGAVTQNLSIGASYTIPEGFHDGNGTVTSIGITDIDASSTTTQMNQTLDLSGHKGEYMLWISPSLTQQGTPSPANPTDLVGCHVVGTTNSVNIDGAGYSFATALIAIDADVASLTTDGRVNPVFLS